jgi:nucleotide-binding universal stress UspA family protein
MFNTLLVPLDGSPQSECVVDLARRVASVKATVFLLCVLDPSYLLPPRNESGDTSDELAYPAARTQTTLAQSILAAGEAQLAGHSVTVETRLLGGDPAEVVIEQAKLVAAEIVVMGHHHLSRLRRWANPSTSGEVIDRSPCAVLIETRDRM